MIVKAIAIKILVFLTFSWLHLSALSQDEVSVRKYPLNVTEALADPTVPQYFKDVYSSEKIIPADDLLMLSITDSLFSQDITRDYFYFVVFTKSMNTSDGFYSEALGESAHRFVTTQTERFTDFFNVGSDLSNDDLNNWATYVSYELGIRDDKSRVEGLEALMLRNIAHARKEYRNIVHRFIAALQEMQLTER